MAENESNSIDVEEEGVRNVAAPTPTAAKRNAAIEKHSHAGVIRPDILAAQQSFVCPAGFKRSRIPELTEGRSLMYAHGVRVEEIADVPAYSPSQTPTAASNGVSSRVRIPGRFYCMSDRRCRERESFVRISNKCTSSATDHLTKLHGVSSERSVRLMKMERKTHNGGCGPSQSVRGTPTKKPSSSAGRNKKKTNNTDQRMDARLLLPPCKLLEQSKERFLTLEYIKTHTILGLEPLDYMENTRRKNLWLLASSRGAKARPFPVGNLDAREVKKGLVEIYDATTKMIREALASERQTTPIRFLHLSIDCWRAGGKSALDDKYIGIRAHHLTEDFRQKSYLLAIRRFDPGGAVGPEKAGELVTLWAGHVLEEYGLDWSVVVGAVTDVGAEASFSGFPRGVPGVLCEGCTVYRLDRAMVDALGLECCVRGVKKEVAREVVVGARKVIDHLKGFGLAETVSDKKVCREGSQKKRVLRQTVEDRWDEGLEALERFLVRYAAREPDLAEGGGLGLPVGFMYKTELQEIYSLVKSLALVIPTCQSAAEPSSPAAMLRVIMLLSADLDVTKPLELHDARRYWTRPPTAEDDGRNARSEQQQQQAPSSAATEAPPRMAKLPGELTEVGRNTRSLARSAVYERLGRRRWGSGYGEESHLFDMALALHPGCRQLEYVRKLSEMPTLASEIKEKVYRQLSSLVEGVIASERSAIAAAALVGAPAAGAGGEGESNGGHGEGDPKRRRLSSPCSSGGKGQQALEADADTMASAGVFDAIDGGDGEHGDEDEGVSVAKEAAEVVRAWCAAKLPSHYRTIQTGKGLADFWRTYGAKNFRLLSIVARSVLAAPGSAAVLERGPTTGGGLPINRQRCGFQDDHDGGYSEMAMFLCAEFERIPQEISRLSEDAAAGAIPRRLCDRGMREAVGRLWAGGAVRGIGEFALFGGGECQEDCRRDTREGEWDEEETEEEQEGSGERGWVRAS